MAIRFVRPETVTVPLSDGDTITIRKRLTAGERRDMYGRMYFPDSVKVDPMRVHRATVTAYLLDWTAKDADGHPVAIAGLTIADLETVVDGLDPDSFGELVDAIDRATDTIGRDAEKNEPAAAGAIAS
jgi:hypothetical protein